MTNKQIIKQFLNDYWTYQAKLGALDEKLPMKEVLRLQSDILMGNEFYKDDDSLVEITQLEAEFLTDIKDGDFSSDGEGLHGYPTFSKPKIERGVLASLVKKGIVQTEEIESNFTKDTWVSVDKQYQEKDANDERSGYKFTNLVYGSGENAGNLFE